MGIRPVRLVGTGLRILVEQEVLTRCGAWCREWGLSANELDVSVALPGEVSWTAEPTWRKGLRDSDASWWLGWDDDLVLGISRLMFQVENHALTVKAEPRTLATSIAAEAVDALIESLRTLLADSGTAIPVLPGEQPEAEFLPMSGALLISIGFDDMSLYCMLNDAALQPYAARREKSWNALPALKSVSLQGAVGNTTVSLPVVLGPMQFDLGGILTVGVGDVIRFDMPLDTPFVVQAPDGHALCTGFLGRVDNDIAVEISGAQK